MHLGTLQRKTKNTTKKVVGRGGTRGKTSGRGHKGQNARAGNSTRPAVRDMIKKLPKLRGYRFSSPRKPACEVNLSDLNLAFSDGEKVTFETLIQKSLVPRQAMTLGVKILGRGELSKKLVIEGCTASASARQKIEALGGSFA
ncbi:MAG: 50S ribosomal protein L15 [Candidatus Pacebacteria bacterium]|nr:50S ribosomal protein L15 [Candidatus Paceibacterota bacterium]